MNTINLEGELYGYKKKTLAIVATIILVAGVMFYAGAKYEKKKLTALGILKCKNAQQSTKTKKAKNTTPPAGNTTTTPTTNGETPTTTPQTTTTAPVKSSTTPVTQPAQTSNLPK